jgi:hypothetical protein
MSERLNDTTILLRNTSCVTHAFSCGDANALFMCQSPVNRPIARMPPCWRKDPPAGPRRAAAAERQGLSAREKTGGRDRGRRRSAWRVPERLAHARAHAQTRTQLSLRRACERSVRCTAWRMPALSRRSGNRERRDRAGARWLRAHTPASRASASSVIWRLCDAAEQAAETKRDVVKSYKKKTKRKMRFLTVENAKHQRESVGKGAWYSVLAPASPFDASCSHNAGGIKRGARGREEELSSNSTGDGYHTHGARARGPQRVGWLIGKMKQSKST